MPSPNTVRHTVDLKPQDERILKRLYKIVRLSKQEIFRIALRDFDKKISKNPK